MLLVYLTSVNAVSLPYASHPTSGALRGGEHGSMQRGFLHRKPGGLSLYFLFVFPVLPRSFPVNFEQGIMLKTRMDATFVDGLVVILGPISGFSLYFSLLCIWETGSQLTASSTTHSCPRGDFLTDGG